MAVTFEKRTRTVDPATDRITEQLTYKPGAAIQTRGDPKRYELLQLRETEAPTLLWVPESYGVTLDPEPGDTVEWNRQTWVVRDVARVAPDGVTILCKVIVAR